ncbi:unnamed protein product [Blepharisma stoltei]|uniref:Uncharacterized protein n=1 Tax=Blepharisma stoltei TaxID=1481888 RepID=A0AAU9JXE7_9CILI|nr:unnamed protein product [Blepharisma stoltei]
MKILNVKLTKGGREYHASIAVSKDMPVEEFMNLLSASLPIPDSIIIGFKDIEGVLVIPSLICREPEILRTDDYDLILRDKSQPSRPTSANLRQPEEQLSHILSSIRLKYHLSEDEFTSLRSWIRENNRTVHQILQNYLRENNVEGFSDWIFNSSRSHRKNIENDEEIKEELKINRSQVNLERPQTTRANMRPMTRDDDMRRGYQKYIQVVIELEQRGLLDQKDLGVIKALILRDNKDAMRELGSYFMHGISLDELGIRLQRVADKLSSGMERPSSPIPRKKELHLLVESLVKANLPSKEDIDILNNLIADENEFVFSAFDVFESDRDQEELIDSLLRAIKKQKKNNKEPLPSNSFYPDPPPIETAPHTQEIDYNFMWKIIQDFNIGENWSFELKGTLKALMQSASKIMQVAFEQFIKNEDNDLLEEELKNIVNLYFHVLMAQCFTPRHIKMIKNQEKLGSLEDISQKFANDGNVYKFFIGIIELLDLKDVQNPRNRILEHVAHLLEDNENIEDPLDAYDTLTNILSNSKNLSDFSQILTRLYEDQNPELIGIIQSYHNGAPIEGVEEDLLKLIAKNKNDEDFGSDLIDIIQSDFTEEQLFLIRDLISNKDPCLFDAYENYQNSKNKEDLIKALGSLINTPDNEFLVFIQENFDEEKQEKLIKMMNEQDSRLKSAISLYDFTTDKDSLIETLNFLLREDPN